MNNDQGCVNLGRACADACNALYQGLKGKRSDELNQSTFEAIGDLNTWVGPEMRTPGDSLTNVMIAEL